VRQQEASMAVIDKSTTVLNGAATYVALNASTGQAVLIPPRTRLIEVSCSVAFRAAIVDLDGVALAATNAHYYAADMVHPIWVGGVQPGGVAESVVAAASREVTFQATSGTPNITMTFRT
jgi:hypothetical protein